MESAAYLTGQLLLALPGIGDPRFERAAIAMCAHDKNGAMGIGTGAIIADLGLHELLAQFGIEPGLAPDAPVHFGGPVEPQRGFVLHSSDWSGQDTVDVAGRWSLSGTIDVLRAIAEGKGPARWLVALGYAGWGAGQLEGELTRHGWFNAPADADLLFGSGATDRWENGFKRIGIDPRMLGSETGRA
jgi:putative transcriptional regulator